MKKARILAGMSLVVVALVAAFATYSYAGSSSTARCDGCHEAGVVQLHVTQTSNNGVSASYDVSMTGGAAWAVFDGSNRLAGAVGTTGSFTVPCGKTYDVFGCSTDNSAKVSVSPTLPPDPEVSTSTPDATAPITAANVKASYVGTATISITASDNVGGWGLGYIYYRIDDKITRLTTLTAGIRTSSATAVIPAPVSGQASHRIAYWSQDNYGNVEARHFATFTVEPFTKPYVGNPVAPSTMSRYRYYSVYGYLKPKHTKGTSPVKIYRYRLTSSGWKQYGSPVSAKAYDYSSYTKCLTSIRLPYAGKWRLRAYAPADTYHYEAWSSGYDYVTVK